MQEMRVGPFSVVFVQLRMDQDRVQQHLHARDFGKSESRIADLAWGDKAGGLRLQSVIGGPTRSRLEDWGSRGRGQAFWGNQGGVTRRLTPNLNPRCLIWRG